MCFNFKQYQLSSFVLVIATLMSCTDSAEVVKPSVHWEYENPNWAAEGFGECSQKIQSPVNIDTTKTVKAELGNIIFQYSDFPMKIVDNGHTIQVNKNGANEIALNGTTFKFQQFHFHYKSEHQVQSKAAEMELHLVHSDETTGNLTVLGIFLEAGAENPFIKKVWDNIPATKSQEATTNIPLNLNDILPTDKRYYTYTGSLTSPPCSQGLQWIVFKEPVKVSAAQIQKFATLYHNARPIQPLNNRLILEKK